MTAAQMNLLVIYTNQLTLCRDFYADLGMEFTKEQHGKGPEHYAAVLTDGAVFEIYPATPERYTATVRLGLRIRGAASNPPLALGRHVLRDPDGRAVDVVAD